MSNLNLGYVGIVVQSFAAFIGLSVLLGRIYFLSYFEAIGIPPSSVEINLLDYAVISPDVTVLGIWVAVSVGTLFVAIANNWIAPTRTLQFERILIGVCLLAIAVAVTTFGPNDYPFTQTLPKGSIGILGAVGISASLGAGIIFGSGLPVTSLSANKSSDSDDNEEVRNERNRLNRLLALLRIGYALCIALIVVFISVGLFNYTTRLGKLDAQRTIVASPTAHIEFASDVLGVPQGSDCRNSSDICTLKVIYVTNDYLYLGPIASESFSAKEHKVYAYPHQAIANIAYLVEKNNK